ncbi:polyphosphate kinase 2 [Prosthecomicrobium pneumaticum]|uniref:ADP/GDP-polyphosphate phosphotransferase n=1 Tax=Prosthecomicrobium pneumaticum TaxID=81895 RepID=A0A7W9FME9_9HYPH|nr:polyphosphate kinase 2 [Prosthecomicrobium pneumaticum]MBB5753329.1 polyphosphate kinase 2 [Prosthecomicrobium pneumaticum]
MARNDKKKKKKPGETLPAEIAPAEDAPAIDTKHGAFDLDDPVLPAFVAERAFASGGYPYTDKLGLEPYLAALRQLQIELVKLQQTIIAEGRRLVLLFEGRDAAGKGGAIFAMRQNLNPRSARTVALPKPTPTEAGQWYFQRYIAHLPTAGEMVLFDRSWYNRAGVEKVMGFCDDDAYRCFLREAPKLEEMLIDDGIVLFKFWLEIGREMQMKQFHERRHDPLKIWKLSPIDYAALEHYDDYTEARDRMLDATDTRDSPWTIVRSNDKKRARLEIIRHVLAGVAYAGREKKVIGTADPRIIGGRSLLG